MELYGNSNIDQSIKDNSKIDADKFDESKNSPVKVLIDPSDISDYY